MTRTALAGSESFDDTLPQPRFVNGYYRIQSGLQGAAALADARRRQQHRRPHVLDWASVTPGTPTMLGFATRRSTDGGY
jgi:hypothetical protein